MGRRRGRRRRGLPELGNDPMAWWDSVIWALADLGYPFVLQESTSRFDGKGCLMLNLLRAPAGVYLVSPQAIIDGKESNHGAVKKPRRKGRRARCVKGSGTRWATRERRSRRKRRRRQ